VYIVSVFIAQCASREQTFRHGAANWAPLTCLDAAAVAIGSLNFKSQRAGRVAIDGWTRASLFPPRSVPQPHLNVRRPFRIFSPLLSPPPPFSFSRPLSPVRGYSEATTEWPLPPRLCKTIIVECGQLFPDARWRHARALSPGHVLPCLPRKEHAAQKCPDPLNPSFVFVAFSTQHWVGSAVSFLTNLSYTSLLLRNMGIWEKIQFRIKISKNAILNYLVSLNLTWHSDVMRK